MKIRAHVIVSGIVTGVNFRYHTKREADKYNVFGWIKNLSDDEVEAVFEGEREDLEKVIDFCKRGPSLARVDDIKIDYENFKGEFKDFRIIH